MEKGNFVYSGWRANGFVALVGLLVLIAGGIQYHDDEGVGKDGEVSRCACSAAM